jgi:hypothetical protein
MFAHALHAAVKAARETPGATLAFPKGVYELRDESAVKVQDDWMSGKLKGNPERPLFAPYAPHVRGLDFDGAKDATSATLRHAAPRCAATVGWNP